MLFIYFLLTSFMTPELEHVKSELVKHDTVKIYESNSKALSYQKADMDRKRHSNTRVIKG